MTAAVELCGVVKRFRRGSSHESLRDVLSHALRRVTGRSSPRGGSETFTAIDGVSFSVPRGGAIGVIGPNGAGKSTILKLLGGILRPDEGTISVRGRLAALIEVGAGFHGDLSGRENIFLNGTLLGMSRCEIRRKFDDIVSFAGLERFMEMPVKRYSSGMYARLGFSIAAHVDPDVLLVDEVLSVGDAVFRLRCLDRMRRLVAEGTTLVFVTHDLDQMQTICRRAVVLRDGLVAFDGAAGDAVGHYMSAMAESYVARPTDLAGMTDRGQIRCVELIVGDSGESLPRINPGARLGLRVRFESGRTVQRLVVEVNLRSAAGQQLLSLNSGRDEAYFRVTSGQSEIGLEIDSVPLAPGQYFWNVRLWDAESGETLADTPFRYPMAVNHSAVPTGVLCLPHVWTVGQVAAGERPAGSAGVREADLADVGVRS